jgi:hypothetical protein
MAAETGGPSGITAKQPDAAYTPAAARKGLSPPSLPLKNGDPLAILAQLRHKGAIAGTERLDGSEAAFGHKAGTCHLRGSRIGFM